MKSKPYYTLVFTSILWCIPASYALIYKNSISPLFTYIISIASINHWLDPLNKKKLMYDEYTCRIGCFLYLINSLIYLQSIYIKICAFSSVICYYFIWKLSCHLYNNNNNNWFPVHIIFHLMVFISKFILYYNL